MGRTFSEIDYTPKLDALLNRLRHLVEQVEGFDLTERTPGLLWKHIGEIERWADAHHRDPRSRSCIDRIEGQYADRLEDIRSMVGWYQAWSRSSHGHRQEKAQRRIEESILSAEIENGRLEVQLSWGGPSDGFCADVDEDGRLDNVRYYFRDWFDGAEIHVTDDVVEEYLNHFNSRNWTGMELDPQGSYVLNHTVPPPRDVEAEREESWLQGFETGRRSTVGPDVSWLNPLLGDLCTEDYERIDAAVADAQRAAESEAVRRSRQ